ncbi:tellurite resistance/C4-dicarboxylate transporter family protein [Streptomyces sp. NBC_00536]|uniref:tellurite resistance/C4-dicarboxylate transporter family protein n=1 Tax=Streptomyces sp. NBC_00536 TaxID=2975769 RepID=UPI002E815A2D|nr:tellurite resistance/C4-dicarboxylate transporter family protein [Streptomyces sp. NBC_00536]WUC82808.1 tellurite resistance/C4-dicarboxylate transporter family protein [Streptomyces sp. NBC_00536]
MNPAPERPRGTPDTLGPRWWAGLPPAAGAAVMAAGIISVGLHLTGHEAPSLVALAVAGALWLVLAADFGARLAGDRGRFRSEADTPAALTAVAATAVLGTRLSLLGWRPVAVVLLALAALLWPGLMLAVLRHWHRGAPGAAFLVCVATQALAVLAAVVAADSGQDWLAWAALAAFCLGLLLYAQALVRFDFREVVHGAGDQWVAGGALAICALAGSKLTASPVWAGWAHTALRTATLVTLALSLVWYAVLLAAELARPRPRYDIRRWATVFPLGMTAAACLSAAGPTGVGWLRPLGEILLWVALAAWLLTFTALVRTHPGGDR